MGQISDLARSLLRGGIGVKDVNKLIKAAKADGITEAEKAELKALLSNELGDKFTAKGKANLQKFLEGTAPTPAPTPAPNPSSTPKSVRDLAGDLGRYNDAEAIVNAFKADFDRVKAELIGHPSFDAAAKETRTFEFFERYADRFETVSYGLSEEKKVELAKRLIAGMSRVEFGAQVLSDADKDGAVKGLELLIGDDPEAYTVRANHVPWSTTYWPMAGSLGNTDGSASSNLWAKDGALDKFDKLLKARGKKTGALEFERLPSLNWMLGNSEIMKGKPRYAEAAKTGHYIPDSGLSETNAEKTTGVDFNGNGKLDENVKWDFLDGFGNFGTDGKTEGSMSVGWWGSCDKVALAGALFREPKKDVIIDGVTFTAQDIKGLLTVIADSQAPYMRFAMHRYDAKPDVIRLKNGTTLSGRIQSDVLMYQDGMRRGSEDFLELTKNFPAEVKIKLNTGEDKTLKAEEIALIRREDKLDNPIIFHLTVPEWLESGQPMAMDYDSGDHVWNGNFWKAETKELTTKPSWAPEKLVGYFGPVPEGAKVRFFEREVKMGSGGTRNYEYWLVEKDGQFVNGGWGSYASNPDFIWGPQNAPSFTGHNERNPFVDPALVKELYLKSIE